VKELEWLGYEEEAEKPRNVLIGFLAKVQTERNGRQGDQMRL
jgi:hypothetical protein